MNVLCCVFDPQLWLLYAVFFMHNWFFCVVCLIQNFFYKPPQPSHERKKTQVNPFTFLFPVVWKCLGNNSERKENVTHTTHFRINWRNSHTKLIFNAQIFVILFVMSFVGFPAYHICLLCVVCFDILLPKSCVSDWALSFVFILILLGLIINHYSCRKERTVQDLVMYWPSISVEISRASWIKLRRCTDYDILLLS